MVTDQNFLCTLLKKPKQMCAHFSKTLKIYVHTLLGRSKKSVHTYQNDQKSVTVPLLP